MIGGKFSILLPRREPVVIRQLKQIKRSDGGNAQEVGPPFPLIFLPPLHDKPLPVGTCRCNSLRYCRHVLLPAVKPAPYAQSHAGLIVDLRFHTIKHDATFHAVP